MSRGNKILVLRSWYALIGVFILAFGAATLRIGHVGLDPYTAANIGVGQALGLSLGIYQLIINLVILAIVFLLNKKYIGVGTIINMVLTGFFIDFFFTWLYEHFFTITLNLFSQFILLLLGVIIFTFGASFYMSAEEGNAPYDSVAPLIVDFTGAPYRFVRIAQDVFFVILAFLFGDPVGIGTVINAFFTGPLISFWNTRVSEPLIENSVKKRTEP